MSGAGFFEQKSVRPGGLALVIGMHAAAFAGLILIKTDVVRLPPDIIDVINVQPPAEPEPEPEPQRDPPRQQPTVLDAPRTIIDLPVPRPPVADPPMPPVPPPTREIGRTEYAGTPELPPPPPVRVEAQIDPRYADDLQPPYPPREELAQREGVVRVRVTIGADGRVKAVERVNSTSDAFWQATQRHALAHWRFRPATLDGRAVESRKVMNVYFRIEA